MKILYIHQKEFLHEWLFTKSLLKHLEGTISSKTTIVALTLFFIAASLSSADELFKQFASKPFVNLKVLMKYLL